MEEWFQILIDPTNADQTKFNCYYCSKYSKEFRIPTQSLLAQKEGVMDSKDRNHILLRDHANSPFHMLVMEKYNLKYGQGLKDKIKTELQRVEKPEYHVTNNHLRSVYYLVQREYSFRGYSELIELQKLHFGAKIDGI